MNRFGLLLIAFGLAMLASPGAVQPPPEGAFGRTAEIPRVVAMAGEECLGKEIAWGRLSIADHDVPDGTFNIVSESASASVAMPRGAIGLLSAAAYKDQPVVLVVRPRRCALQELRR